MKLQQVKKRKMPLTINHKIKKRLKSFFNITTRKIRMQHGSMKIAGWVISMHRQEITENDAGNFLCDNKAFKGIILQENFPNIYNELLQKILSSH